jgi:hypothetical protein
VFDNRMVKPAWLLLLIAVMLVLATPACNESRTPTQSELSAETSVPTSEPPPSTEPTREATSKPEPTPEPTADISGCTLGAVFQADINVPDNTRIEAGQPFAKTWRIRNTGTCDWGPGYRFTFIDGDQMGGADSVGIPETPAGESVEITVELVAPVDEGQHRGDWQVCVNKTECFGDRMYVQIAAYPRPTVAITETRYSRNYKSVEEWEGVLIGMHSGEVLKLHPFTEQTEPMKTLESGKVAFYYEGVVIVFRSAPVDGAPLDADWHLFVDGIYIEQP